MAWDLMLDANRDLIHGYVCANTEVMQRIVTRLKRETAEWFLDLTAGIPWYLDGKGLLGSKSVSQLELVIRREVTNTEGVDRIVSLVSSYIGRNISIMMVLQLTGDDRVSVEIQEGNVSWRMV